MSTKSIVKKRPIAIVILVLAHAVLAHTALAQSRSVPAWIKEGKPKDQPTRLIEDLPGFRPQAEPRLDAYGGSLATSLKATGFFRVEKIRDRWWMVTPDGHPCFNIAATSVNVSKSSPTLSSAFQAKFKDTADWRDQTIALLRDHGFTGTGAFSNDEVLNAAPNRLPYTLNANFMSAYGKRRGGTKMGTGHVNYPNDCIFAFDPASRRSATNTPRRWRSARTTRSSSAISPTMKCRSVSTRSTCF